MSDKYAARISPVPTIVGNEVTWGWRVELTDNGDEKVYPFEGGAEHPTAQAALAAGTKAIRSYVRALDDVGVYDVNLTAPDPIVEEEESATEDTEESKQTEEPTTEEPVTE